VLQAGTENYHQEMDTAWWGSGERKVGQSQTMRSIVRTVQVAMRGWPDMTHHEKCSTFDFQLSPGLVVVSREQMSKDLMSLLPGHLWYCGVVMSGEDAPRPCLENLIVLEIKTNKQTPT
jgi:hypothetical protein